MRAAVLLVALVVLIGFAAASWKVAHNAAKIKLRVGPLGKEKQVALVSYQAQGKSRNVLVWGALNFRPYSKTVKQYLFKYDYSGGHKSFGNGAYKNVKNQCVPDAAMKAKLPLCIYACKMPDGTYWSLQVWQRLLRNMGVKPKGKAYTRMLRKELHISHFNEESIPTLWFKFGWVRAPEAAKEGRHLDHMYGTFSAKLRGSHYPVYGGGSTPAGVPTDTYGRNIYVDIRNPEFSKRKTVYTQPGGWVRFNGFLSHKRTGVSCAFVKPVLFGVSIPSYDRSTGFRAFAMGPGVTPIAGWIGPPPGVGNYDVGGFPDGYYSTPSVKPVSMRRTPYDKTLSGRLAKEQIAIAGPNDKQCSSVMW